MDIKVQSNELKGGQSGKNPEKNWLSLKIVDIDPELPNYLIRGAVNENLSLYSLKEVRFDIVPATGQRIAFLAFSSPGQAEKCLSEVSSLKVGDHTLKLALSCTSQLVYDKSHRRHVAEPLSIPGAGRLQNALTKCNVSVNDPNSNEGKCSESRCLFLDGLDLMVTKQQLHGLFEPYGFIESISIHRKYVDQDVHTFAFINYFSVEMALVATYQMIGNVVGGRTPRFGFGKDVPSKCVKICNLGPWINEDELQVRLGLSGTVEKFSWRLGDHHAYVVFAKLSDIESVYINLCEYETNAEGKPPLRVETSADAQMQYELRISGICPTEKLNQKEVQPKGSSNNSVQAVFSALRKSNDTIATDDFVVSSYVSQKKILEHGISSCSTRNLWVYNLEPDVKYSELRALLQPYGLIIKLYIAQAKKKRSASARVEYFSTRMAWLAKESLKGSFFKGRLLDFGFGKSAPSSILCINGIRENKDEEIVRSLCNKYGTIQRFSWPMGKNYAYVVYDSVSECKTALANLQGVTVLNTKYNKIDVDFSDTWFLDSKLNDEDFDCANKKVNLESIFSGTKEISSGHKRDNLDGNMLSKTENMDDSCVGMCPMQLDDEKKNLWTMHDGIISSESFLAGAGTSSHRSRKKARLSDEAAHSQNVLREAVSYPSSMLNDTNSISSSEIHFVHNESQTSTSVNPPYYPFGAVRLNDHAPVSLQLTACPSASIPTPTDIKPIFNYQLSAVHQIAVIESTNVFHHQPTVIYQPQVGHQSLNHPPFVINHTSYRNKSNDQLSTYNSSQTEPVLPVNPLESFPIVWSGALSLKGGQFIVDLHLVSGSASLATSLLSSPISPDHRVLQISQRLVLSDAERMSEFERRIISCRHGGCLIVVAAPSAVQHENDSERIRPLTGLCTYLHQKDYAGVAFLPSGCQDNDSRATLQLFPNCKFAKKILQKEALELSEFFPCDDHLLGLILWNFD